jgi:hypothetical protein
VVTAAGVGLVDLLFPLPEGPRRIAVAGWLIGCVGVAVWGTLAALSARRHPAEFFATFFERGRALADNALINGVQFSRVLATNATGTASESLMRAEIDRAEHVAEHVAPRECVDHRAVRRRGAALVAVIVIVAATGLLWPEVWAAIGPRFYDPSGDHPPFCRTKFAVRYETDSADGRIARGDNVRVIVDLSGEIPDRAWLVVRGADTAMPAERVELFRRTDAEWAARFDDIRSDLLFRVHVPRGYSTWRRLTLARIPHIVAALAGYSPPAGAGRRPYEKPIDRNGICEVRGTSVRLTLRSDRPLREGEIILTGNGYQEKPLTMRPVQDVSGARNSEAMPRESPSPTPSLDKKEPEAVAERQPAGEVDATFLLEGEGHLTATITDTAGLRSRDRFDADLHILEEPRPADDAPSAVSDELRGQIDPLLREFARLVAQLGDITKEAERREADLAPSPPDKPTADTMREQLRGLSADDKSFRDSAAALARRLDAAGRSADAPAPTTSASPKSNEGNEGNEGHTSAPVGDAIKSLSDALKETAGREGGRELAKQAQKSGTTDGQSLHAVQRMLDDLKRDTEGLCGKACEGACKQIGDAMAASEGSGRARVPSGASENALSGKTQGLSAAGNGTTAGAVEGTSPGSPSDGTLTAAPTDQPSATGTVPTRSLGHGTRATDDEEPTAAARPSPAGRVETITPDEPVPIDVGPVRGEQIPARYKDLTEAYFRRLAEDNR